MRARWPTRNPELETCQIAARNAPIVPLRAACRLRLAPAPAQSAPTSSVVQWLLLSEPDPARARCRCAPQTSRPRPPAAKDCAPALCLEGRCLVPARPHLLRRLETATALVRHAQS